MAKRKSTKGQITIYKNTHKTKDRVTRTPLKPGVNSGAPEGQAVLYIYAFKSFMLNAL